MLHSIQWWKLVRGYLQYSTSIDHECIIGDFSHIAPGAVLCGNVKVGRSTFIGANSVIRQGINIGNNVIIGAGTVVVKDIPDNTTVIGNPARTLVKKPEEPESSLMTIVSLELFANEEHL